METALARNLEPSWLEVAADIWLENGPASLEKGPVESSCWVTAPATHRVTAPLKPEDLLDHHQTWSLASTVDRLLARKDLFG